jgi:hypothetical protein
MTELNLTALGAGFREKVDNRTGDDRVLASLLKRTGLMRLWAAADASGSRLATQEVDKALEAAGITGQEAIAAKLRLLNAGLMSNDRDASRKTQSVPQVGITGRWTKP